MPRSRRKSKQRVGREKFTEPMELFLAGDNTAFSDDRLLHDLIGEKFFMDLAAEHPGIHYRGPLNFTAREKKRLEKLDERWEQWNLEDDHRRYRERAKLNGVLPRYVELISEGKDPSTAYTKAYHEYVTSLPRCTLEPKEAR